MSFVLTAIYIAQVVAARSNQQNWEVLSESDLLMHHWVMFGLGLSLTVTMASVLVLILVASVLKRSLYRRERWRNVATVIVMAMILVIKLVYYFGWVTDGLVVFYNDINEEEISLTVYRSAMGFLMPLHILDIVRQVIVVALLVFLHLKFKKEAVTERLRIESGQ